MTTFTISYRNPHEPVAAPERYDGYDVESAMYDFSRSGASATVNLDEYRLELSGTGLIELVSGGLEVAEKLHDRSVEASETDFRPFLPDVPERALIYSMMFPFYMYEIPVIVFALHGDDVWVYTRTYQASAAVVLVGRDRGEPLKLRRDTVVEVLRSFVRRYLDDVALQFPFLEIDALYRQFHQRLAALEIQ